ncbi:MAG: PC4/YdbC family ssDNA-binding protein [Elusimicrobiota bacterium]|nr:PC4/YdbC family ssDNA-binding protein [Elusimicrobiota bacterium]
MAEGEKVEFKPLLDAGSLPLTETSDIRFYVDEFKGHKYASVRTFVKGDAYSGPTKSGVTLNARVLEEVLKVLEKLPAEPTALEDVELLRVPKKAGVELVVRITLFKDTTGVDLREWVDEPEYKGWSKKGVRLPYKDLAKALDFLRKMKAAVAKA